MGKKKQESNEDIWAWLLGFESIADGPVVLSLLIQDGEIEFQTLVKKDLWKGDGDDDGDGDGPEIKEMKELKNKKLKDIYTDEDKPNYIS